MVKIHILLYFHSKTFNPFLITSNEIVKQDEPKDYSRLFVMVSYIFLRYVSCMREKFGRISEIFLPNLDTSLIT